MDESSQIPISAQSLKAFCIRALLQAGMRKKHAAITAEVLVATDLFGIHTHGTYNLRNYIAKIRAGGMDAQASPKVVADGPAWAMLDGRRAIAMVTSCLAMQMAIKKAKSVGVGFAGVRNSNHFGAAAYYASMALDHDMIGLVFTNSGPAMVAPGSRTAVIGNNPVGYAVPAGKEYPLLLDVAMSVVAGTKIQVARESGKAIPFGWMVDEAGNPTTDVSKYPLSCSLLPVGGHKGYGFAMLAEVLAGVVTGAGVTEEVVSWGPNLPVPPNTGHAFVAIDVGAMMPIAKFRDRMDQMIRRIHAAPRAKGVQRIYVPGEMEWEKRSEALKHGLRLPEETRSNLRALAAELDIETPKELSST